MAHCHPALLLERGAILRELRRVCKRHPATPALAGGLSRFVARSQPVKQECLTDLAPKGLRSKTLGINHLSRIAEVFAWWEHAAAQQLLADAAAHFLRPVHPAVLAEAKIMARVFVWREAQVVQPEQHHARSAV